MHGASWHLSPTNLLCPPDAGLLYCMEFLEQNMDWLKEKMDPLIQGATKHCRLNTFQLACGISLPCSYLTCIAQKLRLALKPSFSAEGCYILIDCPGQVELFTLHESLPHIVQVMTNKWHIRCAAKALHLSWLPHNSCNSAPCTLQTAVPWSPVLSRSKIQQGGCACTLSTVESCTEARLTGWMCLQACHCWACGCTFVHRCWQVPERAAAEPVQHAAPGAAPHKCALQG